MRTNRHPTIKQVARAAQVSTQTVSRVINDRPDVAPETRARVQAAIQDLGFLPNALARSLIQKRSYTLGVVTAGLKYIGPSRTLHGITSKADEMGYTLLLKEFPQFDISDIHPLIQPLLARHVDGIVWAVPEVGSNHQWANDIADVPVPIVFLTMKERANLTIVHVDNFAGAVMATEHLLEQGYRNIGHITGPMDWWESQQRKAGWESALKKAGRKVGLSHSTEGNWSSSSGETAFIQLLSQYPDMDAVFVANDQMALSVLQVACSRDIDVPRELGVVGFDGIPESPYYWPPLTTVSQDQYVLGSKAVEEVVEAVKRSQGEKYVSNDHGTVIMPELIVRKSSVRQSPG